MFTLTAEADRVLSHLVMFLTIFFPLDVQNEIQLISRVFSYSWLVCLLRFSLRNASLVEADNPISDGIAICFSPCWMRARIIKAQAILALLDSFQELHLEIW